MKCTYVIWGVSAPKHACGLTHLSGVEDKFELIEGISRHDSFPAEASFRLDPDTPRNMLLTDNLVNPEILLVVSSALKEFVCRQSVDMVESLPVSIIDHKGRKISSVYYILHPLAPVECLDLDQCGVEWSRIAKEMVAGIRKIALVNSMDGCKRKIFRPKGFPPVVLVRRDLADSIDQQGFLGTNWIELAEYQGY